MDVKTVFLNGDLEEEAPKQWHQKFDEVVLSNDYLLNQADKCVDLTKELLLSKFSMKDMGKADVILVSTPMDTSEKLMPNNSQAISQLKYTSNPEGYTAASKKKTCITSSIMESEFVALAAAGKEAKCASTLAKAYSQMYNGKSRHLGVRHSMVRELITNRVISIDFMRSTKFSDDLTKGLVRLGYKFLKGMGIKVLTKSGLEKKC
ncbi:hypothetical protein Tco_0280972 [Tanacetum coccineum]